MSLMQLAVMGSAPPVTAIEDVFSAFTYTGNGSTQTITNGIAADLVWIKERSGATPRDHSLFDTVRGAPSVLWTSQPDGAWVGYTTSLTAFNSDGFSLGADASAKTVNFNTDTYISWSFAQAAKFFKVAQVTVSGSNQTVDLSSLGTVGMVSVKRTDSTSAWFTFHRSCTSGKLVYLNTTDAETTDGSITLSGTTLTLVQATIGNGTFIVYAWAHDTGADGLIQCGSFTGNASTDGPVITLGWEPQLVLIKSLTQATTGWVMLDTARGMSVGGNDPYLKPQSSDAEGSAFDLVIQSATGFKIVGTSLGVNGAGETISYLAIRRGPMKLPTVGTQVYNAIARTGTGAAATVTGVGFPPDLVITKAKDVTYEGIILDRLRGANKYITPTGTGEEDVFGAATDLVTSFNMDGVSLGADASIGLVNRGTPHYYINWFFRRYPGCFDEVCFTGTAAAQTVSHNLTVAPELAICKYRSTAGEDWRTLYTATWKRGSLNMTDAFASANAYFTATPPTATELYLDNFTSSTTCVAYLFATLAGISKVGTYTGNGTNQTIDCGFTTGARFVLVKAISTTGNWNVGDSTRGLVAGDDPFLALNQTDAEVTDKDWLDPDNSGFVVNETTGPNANTNGVTYIYLAFA